MSILVFDLVSDRTQKHILKKENGNYSFVYL